MKKYTYYLNLGSNLDDREGNIWAADLRLSIDLGLVTARSEMVDSEPWGFKSDNAFINRGIAVESVEEPLSALQIIHRIEREMGSARHRNDDGSYRDRLIDIDIMAIDDLVVNEPELQVPHRHLASRDFFLRPLAQLAPQWRHPVTGLTAAQMLAALHDNSCGQKLDNLRRND